MRTIMLLLALTACDFDGRSDWERAPLTHVCTGEQMSKVQAEAAWCKANTAYFDTYCYGAAILRNCELRGQGKQP